MKVLVVGKGTKAAPLSCGGHIVEFIVTPPTGKAVPSAKPYNLVLFHLSDDKASFASVLNQWKQDGSISRVIAISGGGLNDAQTKRLRELGEVPFIGGIDDAEKVLRLRWQVIPTDCNWTATKIARTLKEPDPLLPALMILGQAVLCSSVRTSSDEKDIECLDLINRSWAKAVDEDASIIRRALEVFGISAGANPFGLKPESFSTPDFWKRFCPKLDPSVKLDDWVQDQFGPLPCGKTKELLNNFSSGKVPTVVAVAAAMTELKGVIEID